ncbi:proline racemase [uncultured Corynebacterium sp.]|uniref:proline racemase n=1 Tax=uncultured Corynebacterium sp. TaxID=159447 RepID=UPI0025949A20|nr:proline racemase [uncultured Corynebacterium sp.]
MTELISPAAVRDWNAERAKAGVARAKVVTDVTYDEARIVTVTIDPSCYDRDTWQWLKDEAGDTLGEFYATLFGWTDNESTQLREMVKLCVVSADGAILETVDTAAYQRKKNPQFPAGKLDI